jgi:hypothetical protein
VPEKEVVAIRRSSLGNKQTFTRCHLCEEVKKALNMIMLLATRRITSRCFSTMAMLQEVSGSCLLDQALGSLGVELNPRRRHDLANNSA